MSLLYTGKESSEMMVAALFFSVSVFFMTLQEVSSTYYVVTNYSSPVSNYSKLAGANEVNYTVWASRCEG